jgi:hypothetical protein
MRTLLLMAGILGAGLSLTACADKLPGKPLTAEDFEIAAAQAKQLGAERQKFNVSHPLKGQIADQALRPLLEEGYVCHIDYVDHIRRDKNFAPYFVRTPMVLCMQRSTQPNDLCVERHANLSIGWQDPTAPEPELRLQLVSSQITDVAFRCATTSDIKR